MARMPDIEAEAARAVGWIEHHMPHHHAAPQTPAAPPVNLAAAAAAATAPPQGDTMALFDTLEKDFADVKAKFQGLDEAALSKLNAATANPETADVLSDIASLAGLPIPPGTIASMAGSLKALLSLYAPDPVQTAPAQPAPQAVPAQ